MVNGAEIVANA